MPEYVQGVNPTIIEWARKRSGYTLKEVAKSLNKDVETISNWESGECAPTYAQLEKLAHKFKRPIALFFFPEVPDEPDLIDQLALRSSEIEELSPNIRLLLRHAAARQLSLMELNMGVNPAARKIFRDLHTQIRAPVADLARQVRAYLDINVETQASWNTPTEALENWRNCIQEKGIFVFKDAFQDDFVDGFSLVHEQFPVIYLNNSRPHARQIFSLFHELAHLLLRRNGITRGVKIGGVQIERFCNRFAAEFLVPSSDLETRLDYPDYDDAAIWELASHYKVSRPVILLKLIDRSILKPTDYKRKAKKWKEAHQSKLEKEAESKNSGGGDYYNTRAVYLGYRYLELAFSRYHQGQCSIEELAEHLNVKVKSVPGLEDRLLRKVAS
ncbi:MAG: XRE family transcriptional regulator [Candidatus Poribacteria bacterium]|nr:XRE family transcriptional regulator [Candidatus Poribacteria bacterium]